MIKYYIYSSMIFDAETQAMNKQCKGKTEASKMCLHRQIRENVAEEKKEQRIVTNTGGEHNNTECDNSQTQFFRYIKRYSFLLKNLPQEIAVGKHAGGQQQEMNRKKSERVQREDVADRV